MCISEPPIEPVGRLLTRTEYARTLRDLLGETSAPVSSLPPESEVDGYPNNARSHQASPLWVEGSFGIAREMAQRARERGLDTLYRCTGEGRDCATEFAEAFGRRAFRRPLDEDELSVFVDLYDRSAALGHEGALTSVVEAMLLSPQFLYRFEAPLVRDEDSGSPTTTVPLGPYELASRLSYFVWGTMPDAQLLDAAESGALETTDEIAAETERLLGDPRAAERVREFHEIWLDLDQLPRGARDGSTTAFREMLRESLLTFLDDVFWSDGGTFEELFTSSRLFLARDQAVFYGVDANPLETQGALPAWDGGSERAGLLTQPGLLTLLSNSNQSSPILRGVFLRSRLLCETIHPPPPDVDNTPPDPDPNLTTRQRFAVHTEDRGCAGCHRLIDPAGFSFEGYDHLGRVRSDENGQPIDTSGELVDPPDEALEGPLGSITDLAPRLGRSRVVTTCLTRRWFTLALGRTDTSADECSIDAAVDYVEEHGGKLRDIIVGITTSPAFRQRPRGGSP